MQATVRAAGGPRNAPREELRRPPPGGAPSSRGATTRRGAGATLGLVSLYTTAADARARACSRSTRRSRSPRSRRRLRWPRTAARSRTARARSTGSPSPSRRSPRCRSRFWRRSPLGVFALTTAASASSTRSASAPGPPFGPTIALFLLAASRDDAHPWTRRTDRGRDRALRRARRRRKTWARATCRSRRRSSGSLVWTIAWFAGDRTRLRRERLDRAGRPARARAAARGGRGACADRPRPARLGGPRDQRHPRAGRRRAAAPGPATRQARARRCRRSRTSPATRSARSTSSCARCATTGAGERRGRRARARVPRHARRAPPRRRPRRRRRDRRARRRPLGATADGAAYRIVQESLTNASRHGTGSARVELAFGERRLELDGDEPGRARRRRARGGHGLTGMRERACSLAARSRPAPRRRRASASTRACRREAPE